MEKIDWTVLPVNVKKNDLHVKTFATIGEAEDFVRDHLRYADGTHKNHLIDESVAVYETFENAGRYLVWWEGRLIRR